MFRHGRTAPFRPGQAGSGHPGILDDPGNLIIAGKQVLESPFRSPRFPYQGFKGQGRAGAVGGMFQQQRIPDDEIGANTRITW